MTKSLEIHDLAETGQLQLCCSSDDGPQSAPPVSFQNPVDATDLQEIQWYFRDYLDNPFGASKARAEAVEAGLANLGRLLFEVAFNRCPEAQNLYTAATTEGLGEYHLNIISQRPEFLGLPWETMNQPETGYFANQFASVTRRYSTESQAYDIPTLPTDQLNVLAISPRPGPEEDQGHGDMVVETAQVLESLDVQVELDYVSSPTFAALQEQLGENPARYHLAYLDGVVIDASGQLLLEDSSHSPDPTSPSQFAEMLKQAGVPVALLTGSSQAANDPGKWPEFAASLCQHGVPVVIVLPYPLPGSSTKEILLRQFYQSLVQGTGPAACLAQARQSLMVDPQRLTLTGKQVYWDWITPTAYQSCDYSPAAIESEQPDPLAPPVIQPQQQPAPELQLPAPGSLGLIGRQRELRDLERSLAGSSTVLLTGNTGTGKTELCLGLARWFQRIGRADRPGGVFYSTFEASHPSGLERIVHEIGTTVAGLDFADLNIGQQRQWVVDYLRQHPSLLIWDNVQNAAGFPTGSPGLLEPEELTELNDFLSEVTQDGQSWALVASRRQSEDWLALSHSISKLAGLKGHDRVELASAILDKSGIEPSRVGPEILQLLDLIDGHPLAMQVALPLLKDVPVSVLLGELQKTQDELPESSQEEGRDAFLTALMEYAWGKMSHRSRTHLPFLSLFQRRVMMDILNHITGEQAYRNAMGEELGWGACRTLLRSAQAAGFLEPVSPSVYQIHPALPWFLGSKLGQQIPASRVSQLEQEYVRVYADTADYFMESLYENQDSGVTAVLAEEGNLTQALGLALEASQWDNAQLLIQPLAQVYRMQKRLAELRRLRRQVLEVVGQTAEEAHDRGGADLWLYLLGTEANEAVDLRDLDYAESLNQQLYDYLTSQPEGNADPRTAAVNHQFGLIALNRWQLDEAAGWFQKSLDIIEQGDDRASVADDYFALGQVKQHQRYYTEAKDWYQKALDIHQRLPDEEEMVKDYRALGAVSHLKFEYQEAESWYQRARAAVEEHRDEETAVLVYHELATVAHSQYLFDDAISLYEQALNLSDRLGMEEQMAVEFHHLGLLQQTRGIVFDEAEEWYIAAMNQWEKVGNRRAVGDECRQLGVLFHQQKRYEDAEKWYQQAREIFEALGDVQRMARTYGQLGMITEEQDNLTGALEWVARTHQLVLDYNLPVAVQMKAHLGRLRDKYGQENFETWWREFTGEEAPTDLEVDTSTIL